MVWRGNLFFCGISLKKDTVQLLSGKIDYYNVSFYRAEAERVRLTGAAEARAIEAVGRAEAESMRMKASAYKQYGDAAIMSLVLDALPQIAAEVAVR